MRYLLILFILPLFVRGQIMESIKPILSKDYKASVDSMNKHHAHLFPVDNLLDTLTLKKAYKSPKTLKSIKIKNGVASLMEYKPKKIYLSGEYSSTSSIRFINRLPALQNSYVQGRSINGNILWQGPETDEPFSYGPAINTLEYTGLPYLYDTRGKMVRKGTGNGMAALPTDNSIFKRGFSLSQSLTLKGNIRLTNYNSINFSVGVIHYNENTIFPNNDNSENKDSALINIMLKDWKINLTYLVASHLFSISNRTGLLNRAYQQASISPVSFDVNQAITLPNGMQRTYQSLADNPYFLLSDNGFGYKNKQSVYGLSIERNKKVKLSIDQSFEIVNQTDKNEYKPGTAYFVNGISSIRNQKDQAYFLKVVSSFLKQKNWSGVKHTFDMTANLNILKTDIQYYDVDEYSYKRTSSDILFSYKPQYSANNWTLFADLNNKSYLSSTLTQQCLLMPGIIGSIKKDRLFNRYLTVRLTMAHTYFTFEPSLSQSLSYTSLFSLNTDQSMQYFPVKEVEGFNGINPVKGMESKVGLGFSVNYAWSFSGEYYSKQIKNDVFPYLDNNNIMLANLASHTTNGIEIIAGYNYYNHRKNSLSFNNILSFNTYSTKVDDVVDNAGEVKVAGFKNVYKALIKGQPIGIIMGSTFMRNQYNQIVIGSDGFPLMDSIPKPIGNPTPDFILKSSSTVRWKGFSLMVECEWKQGGDVWNGTQAALDYYGRSKTSADERGITGYVFKGVNEQGLDNTKSVAFYDASQPLSQNKWVRYGPSGIAENYIQKGTTVKIRNIRLGYTVYFKRTAALQFLQLSVTAQNLLIWSPYSGVDSNQLMMDLNNSSGLDYFNLPSTKHFLFNISINF